MPRDVPATEEPTEDPPLCDHRLIIFRPSALATALEPHLRSRSAIQGDGFLAGLDLHPERGGIACRIDTSGTASEVWLDGVGLASALIAYCISAGIPLPSRAGKRIEVMDDRVLLEFRMSFPKPPPPRRRDASGAVVPQPIRRAPDRA
ncbi:MAG: hypothetical protein K2X11_12230 [Acetobacteraceae bacterium]|nr:hypothetical protein [Acetobacteraceae bacterium]